MTIAASTFVISVLMDANAITRDPVSPLALFDALRKIDEREEALTSPLAMRPSRLVQNEEQCAPVHMPTLAPVSSGIVTPEVAKAAASQSDQITRVYAEIDAMIERLKKSKPVSDGTNDLSLVKIQTLNALKDRLKGIF